MSVGTAITAAVIGTVGSVAAAKIGADASSNAAKTQSTAGTNAAQTFQPYQAGAMNAYNKAAAMFGLPAQPVPGAPGSPGAPNSFTGPGTVTGPNGQPAAVQPTMYAPGTGPTIPLAQPSTALTPYSLSSLQASQQQAQRPTTTSAFGS
jgi:hypothetical protein